MVKKKKSTSKETLDNNYGNCGNNNYDQNMENGPSSAEHATEQHADDAGRGEYTE